MGIWQVNHIEIDSPTWWNHRAEREKSGEEKLRWRTRRWIAQRVEKSSGQERQKSTSWETIAQLCRRPTSCLGTSFPMPGEKAKFKHTEITGKKEVHRTGESIGVFKDSSCTKAGTLKNYLSDSSEGTSKLGICRKEVKAGISFNIHPGPALDFDEVEKQPIHKTANPSSCLIQLLDSFWKSKDRRSLY